MLFVRRLDMLDYDRQIETIDTCENVIRLVAELRREMSKIRLPQKKEHEITENLTEIEQIYKNLKTHARINYARNS